MSRLEELRASLGSVHARIDRACVSSGRTSDDVGLVVVTKFFPASDVRLLAELGVSDVGENRHQEAQSKAQECADLGLRWHFVGGLQSNKAAGVAEYSHMVESVDRLKLVEPLSRGAERAGREVEVLLQVSLDPLDAEHRSGVVPDALEALAARVAETSWLRLDGLMAVAPLGEDPEVSFERLARIRETFLLQHPEATTLSAGMSGDLEVAIRHGATHVRVGSSVLGPRAQVL